jgi:DNA-binding NtrC family response regulator
MATVLCVDDEPSVGVVLEHALAKLGHEPILVTSVDDALKVIHRTPLDLILADYRMPKHTGVELIKLLEKEGYRLPVIIMTGYSSIEHAVMSIKAGAIDYLTKPVRPETLEIAVNQALEVTRLRRENEMFRREVAKMKVGRAIIGDGPSFRNIMETIATVAPTRVTVLLEGESGTGKELFARAIHDQSPRAEQAFITINCAAMPEGLVESALFGHEKGAFTGATARSAGAFERAHGGTLLLDEVSEMRLDLQSKLLRVIQEQEFERVGGSGPIKVDVRVIATTNRDLRTEVEAGRFRGDLYYRLNVVPIRTPPLRDRPEDIPKLVQFFLQRLEEQMGVRVAGIAAETIALLQAYHWPGNVRELSNVVERAAILSRGGLVLADAVRGHITHESISAPRAMPAMSAPVGVRGPVGGTPYVGGLAPAQGAPVPFGTVTSATTGASGDPLSAAPFSLDALEHLAIERALVATGGNRTKAAKLLGISERTLRNKLNGPKAHTDLE